VQRQKTIKEAVCVVEITKSDGDSTEEI